MRAHWTLPAEPDAVGMAGDIVRSLVSPEGPQQHRCQAAVLVLRELLVNAVHRAPGASQPTVIDLTITTSTGRLHIEVSDAAVAPPLLAVPALQGHGDAAALEEVRLRSGWRSLDDGRAMWCEIAWPGDAAADHPAGRRPAR
jgi:hypothetical protein